MAGGSMKEQTLVKLRVPGQSGDRLVLCEGDLQNGKLSGAGRNFNIVRGIPRLLADQHDRYTSNSFSREWKELNAGDDVWGRPVKERMGELNFLEILLDRLKGMDFLDVGCGNGLFAREIAATFGANVVAVDISQGLELGRTMSDDQMTIDFVQADVQYPPFADNSFDIIWCAGSIHHTPDPKKTFQRLVPLLKKGGRIFLWLYTPPENRSLKMTIRGIVKEIVCRLPGIVQDLAVYAIACFTLVKHFIIVKVLRKKLYVPLVLKFRHHRMMARDTFTVRYDWHLTKEEVAGWHVESGLKTVYSKYVQESDGLWLAALGERS